MGQGSIFSDDRGLVLFNTDLSEIHKSPTLPTPSTQKIGFSRDFAPILPACFVAACRIREETKRHPKVGALSRQGTSKNSASQSWDGLFVSQALACCERSERVHGQGPFMMIKQSRLVFWFICLFGICDSEANLRAFCHAPCRQALCRLGAGHFNREYLATLSVWQRPTVEAYG